jgi:hypothetical protein
VEVDLVAVEHRVDQRAAGDGARVDRDPSCTRACSVSAAAPSVAVVDTLFGLDPDPDPAAAARAQRRSSKGIAPGDVVEVDRRGRRFYALVTSIHQRPSGHHDLDLRPLDPRTTYFTATIREVVAVWRRAA